MAEASQSITVTERVARMSRDLKLFIAASLAMGVAYSIVDSTFNNFLNERFPITPFQRSFLEFPRELPGVLCVFVTALLWFLCSRRLGVVAMLLGVLGTLAIGFISQTYAIMTVCLFIYSMGMHLFLPASASIGMELAEEGKSGQRLGQLNAVRNAATILGSFLVFLCFRYFGLTFQHTFTVSALAFAVAAIFLFAMKQGQVSRPALFFKLQKEYRLYYILAVLYGSRKQLFITFAPWVLVTVFHQPTQILATLMTIGGIIGILFQPFLGRMIDHFGERVVLVAEAILLVLVCFGYGFSRSWFSESAGFFIVCGCFLLDQMLMSVNMARSTYMKKIALDPSHVQPALTAAVTIDHIFSIAVALIGGAIWNAFGFQYVFLLGGVIALLNFAAALQIHLPTVS
ncbi:MAG TPA: MFS transporter [Anaerolineaceae bacterium]|nr:MFS transporter [Anaerolineaceae bacterium]